MPPPESPPPPAEGSDAYGFLRVRLLIPENLPSAGIDIGDIQRRLRQDPSIHGYEPDPDTAEGFRAYIVIRRHDVEPSDELRSMIDQFGPLTLRPILGLVGARAQQVQMRFETGQLDDRINMRAAIQGLRNDPTVSHVDIRDHNTGHIIVHIRPGITPSVAVQRLADRHPIRLADLDPPTQRLTPEEIVQEYLATTSGRTSLARSMVAPLRNRIDYQSIGRSVFLVEQLPDGALPHYGSNLDSLLRDPIPEIVPLPTWCEPHVWIYDPVTYTKGQVISVTADHVQISVWNSTLMEWRPREEVSRYELLPGEPQPRTVYERLLDDDYL